VSIVLLFCLTPQSLTSVVCCLLSVVCCHVACGMWRVASGEWRVAPSYVAQKGHDSSCLCLSSSFSLFIFFCFKINFLVFVFYRFNMQAKSTLKRFQTLFSRDVRIMPRGLLCVPFLRSEL